MNTEQAQDGGGLLGEAGEGAREIGDGQATDSGEAAAASASSAGVRALSAGSVGGEPQAENHIMPAAGGAAGEPGEVAGSRSSLGDGEFIDGRSVGGFGGKLKPIRTSEQGRALSRRYWDSVEALGRSTIAKESAAGTLSGGVAELVGAQFRFGRSGKPGSTAAAAFAMRSAGLVRRNEGKQAESGSSVAVTVKASGEAAAGLLGLISRLGGPKA